MAGQIGVNTHSILPYRGDLTTDMESNPRLQSGIYRQAENPMTSVDNTALYHGVLICINSIESEYGAYGIQFYFFGDGTNRLARVIEYGSLKKWTTI